MNLVDIKVSLKQLLLDPNNYRLDYYRVLNEYDDSQILELQSDTKRRLEKERLGELRESIIQNGFLEMDRIVVRELHSDHTPKYYVVVEGNRRTAAFKGLLHDYYEGLIDIPDSLIEKANSIGVVCVTGSKSEVEEFSAGLMGIRHVSGPKKWTGYQSARLINDRFNAGKSLTEIGSLLGISAIDAGRRLRGYRAFLQMREDDEFGDMTEKRHYTLLLEFLTPGKNGRDWLEWDNELFKFEHKNNLHRLYKAITCQEGNKPEIKNPTDARKFLKFLEDEESKKLIEQGTELDDLPPITDKNSTNEKQLKNILYMLEQMTSREFSSKEIGYLERISTLIQEIISEQDDM